MEEETMEVVRSEEGGNGLPETPIEQPTEQAPQEPVQPTEPTEELFELPDGRKVDGETLAKEWKENFYPEYTRKSQELAKVKNETLQNNEPANDPYADPEYTPQSYAEIIEAAKKAALHELESKEQARIAQEQAIESEVANQLNEIKTLDKNLNENALFLHANKYGFRDLKIAYQNMKDMSELAKNVQKTTASNIAKRNDPVSISPGATGQRPDPSQFENARDFLRSLR